MLKVRVHIGSKNKEFWHLIEINPVQISWNHKFQKHCRCWVGMRPCFHNLYLRQRLLTAFGYLFYFILCTLTSWCASSPGVCLCLPFIECCELYTSICRSNLETNWIRLNTYANTSTCDGHPPHWHGQFGTPETEVCSMCQGKVFPMERREASGLVMHTKCFKCTRCNINLRYVHYPLLHVYEVTSWYIQSKSNIDTILPGHVLLPFSTSLG